MKAETLIQMLKEHSPSAAPGTNGYPENLILCELQETPLEREVRQFYDGKPYHKNFPSKDLRRRIENLKSDWVNWIIPVTLEDKRTLDVGCGCGFNLAIHGALASVAVGIDVSLGALRQARQYAIDNNVSDKIFLIHGDIRHLNLPDHSFDVITCIGVFHHIPDHVLALSNMARLLDTNGILLLGIYHPGGRFWHRLRTKILHVLFKHNIERKVKWAKRLFEIKKEAQRYNTPEEIYVRDSYAAPVEKAFTIEELAEELQRLGLTLIQVRPSPTISFEKSFEDKAQRRFEKNGQVIPIDLKSIDQELSRIKRHHYWCLFQKKPELCAMAQKPPVKRSFYK